jgi:hypothetical protein
MRMLMTKLGSYEPFSWPRDIISNLSQLSTLQGGAIIRNGCESTDDLDRGTFFIRQNQTDDACWMGFDPRTGAASGVGVQTGDKILLPVQVIKPEQIMQYKEDLFLQETVVKSARNVFESAVDSTGVIYKRLIEDPNYPDDYDDYDEVEQRVDEREVARAWLKAVKVVIEHAKAN